MLSRCKDSRIPIPMVAISVHDHDVSHFNFSCDRVHYRFLVDSATAYVHLAVAEGGKGSDRFSDLHRSDVG
jgi:hypothetical protein